MADGTFRGRWVTEVFRSARITDSVRVALLALVPDMDDAGRVSVPRLEIAARLGRGPARVSERLQAAVDAGLLQRVSAGKKGSTAVYAATLPDGSARPDPINGPPVRTQSEHFGSGSQDAKPGKGSGSQDAKNPDEVRTGGPDEPKKGPDGGDTNISWGSDAGDHLDDVTDEALFDLSASARRPSAKTSSRRRRETPIPDDFSMTNEMSIWVKGRGVADVVDVEYETERFVNHALQKDRRCRDWEAAWRNWMLKAKIDNSSSQVAQSPGTYPRQPHQPYQNPPDSSAYHEDL